TANVSTKKAVIENSSDYVQGAGDEVKDYVCGSRQPAEIGPRYRHIAHSPDALNTSHSIGSDAPFLSDLTESAIPISPEHIESSSMRQTKCQPDFKMNSNLTRPNRMQCSTTPYALGNRIIDHSSVTPAIVATSEDPVMEWNHERSASLPSETYPRHSNQNQQYHHHLHRHLHHHHHRDDVNLDYEKSQHVGLKKMSHSSSLTAWQPGMLNQLNIELDASDADGADSHNSILPTLSPFSDNFRGQVTTINSTMTAATQNSITTAPNASSQE
ncbi:unnamed protein product, partial [Protopolystoma xenopodis]